MSTTDPARPLAVSLGDPAGIAPELICAAWAARKEQRLPAFFVCGGARVLAAAAATRSLSIPIEQVRSPDEVAMVCSRALPVLGAEDGDYRPGAPDPVGARLAFGSLKDAAVLALGGGASGLVTGPIAKAQLAEVGFDYPGQTEFVAAACKVAAKDAVILLAGPQLRTVPLTVHVALSEVPRLVTTDLIVSRARITAEGLRKDFGIAAPRIAIAALNPHGGEGGKFGSEDETIVAPAVKHLRAEGIDASGPHSADALFAPHMRPSFDVALCMYHDQALIPIKALDFDEGVNMTPGLPIVRTSPDHGTAFAIAGKGTAHPGAMITAIRMAGEAAARRAHR